MQFGMPTLIELKSAEACASICYELGLNFVELSMDLPDYQADKLNVDELRRVADKYSVFTPFISKAFLTPVCSIIEWFPPIQRPCCKSLI